MRRLLMIACAALALIGGGSIPSRLQNAQLQKELDALAKRGYTYKLLDNNLVEITNPMTGSMQLKSLNQPSEAEIRTWAGSRGIPILEIDPAAIDTSQFSGMYRYWATVPLSNGEAFPLVVADMNENKRADVYGIFWENGVLRKDIYEVDSTGRVALAFSSSRIGIAMQETDVDRDSMHEINYAFGDSTYNFEQARRDTLSTQVQFVHSKYDYHGTAIQTHDKLGNLDGDTLTDFLYRGSVPDSIGRFRIKTFVAEFDREFHNFRKVWGMSLFQAEGQLGGYEVNDFDADGKVDFAASTLYGPVAIAENVGDNSYQVVWRDTVPFANVYYQGSGDIDRNGFPELFVGATGSGNWTTVFEADSDNHYSPRLLVHLLSGGGFDNPQYLTTDVNGDGKVELVICAGADIYFLNSDRDNSYYVGYLKRENARDAIQFYDFNRDGRKDMIISKTEYVDSTGFLKYSANIFVATKLLNVSETTSPSPQSPALLPNYPNPFNSSTNISFVLAERMLVKLSIFDLTGRRVAVLLEGTVGQGKHTVRWNPKNQSSGTYFCYLESNSKALSGAILFLR